MAHDEFCKNRFLMQQKNLVRRLNENVDDDREVNFQNKIS